MKLIENGSQCFKSPVISRGFSQKRYVNTSQNGTYSSSLTVPAHNTFSCENITICALFERRDFIFKLWEKKRLRSRGHLCVSARINIFITPALL